MPPKEPNNIITLDNMLIASERGFPLRTDLPYESDRLREISIRRNEIYSELGELHEEIRQLANRRDQQNGLIF